MNKIINTIINTLSVLLLIVITNACNKEEKTVVPAPPGNEFITTIELKCTNINDAADTVTGKWVDLTPEDANPDTSHAILNLKKNSVYDCQLILLDETKTPAESVSDEIHERQNYHLFCFAPSSGLGSNFNIVRTDHDTNTPPLEVGLSDRITTTSVSSGSLNVTLHHQPNVKNGSCDVGSVDADVNFQVNIIN